MSQNKATEYFKRTIQQYLEQKERRRMNCFAPRYANPQKNIDDCITFYPQLCAKKAGVMDSRTTKSIPLPCTITTRTISTSESQSMQCCRKPYYRTDRRGKGRSTSQCHTTGDKRGLCKKSPDATPRKRTRKHNLTP